MNPSPSSTSRRRGSVYLPVLIACMVAATLAVGGMLAVQAQSRSARLRSDSSAARMLALSAVEIGRARIQGDSNWRTTYSTGTWVSDLPLGNGVVSLEVTSPAGSLDRNDFDPVVLTATARVGRALQRTTTTLVPPSAVPLTSLTATIASGTGVVFSGASILASSELIASNGNISSSGGGTLVSAKLRAKGSISGGLYVGTTASSVPLIEFPGTDVFQFYTLRGTTLLYAAAPSSGAERTIENLLISPATNPFGSTSAKGIYVIDCGGGNLRIRDCRIVGTLVILNAGTVTVNGEVNWSPTDPTLPALLVDGDLVLSINAENDLSEYKLSPNRNLNPVGTPYPYVTGGATDSDFSDSYPTVIDGLIYASGNASLDGRNKFHTLLAGGVITLSNNPSFVRDDRYLIDPPPGFFTLTSTSYARRFR